MLSYLNDKAWKTNYYLLNLYVKVRAPSHLLTQIYRVYRL